MKRRAYKLALIASLLLSAALIVIWLISCWGQCDIAYPMDQNAANPKWVQVIVVKGKSSLCIYEGVDTYNVPPRSLEVTIFRRPSGIWTTSSGGSPNNLYPPGAFEPVERPILERAGFYFRTINQTFASKVKIWGMPIWAILIFTLLLPAHASWRRIKLSRRRGFCVACGYDLRASPDCCPECGTPSIKSQSPHDASTPVVPNAPGKPGG